MRFWCEAYSELIVLRNGRHRLPRGSEVKNPPANAGDARDAGSIPGFRRTPGGGNGNPLQDSCLENPMDRGAWWAIVHGVTKSQTAHTYTQTQEKPSKQSRSSPPPFLKYLDCLIF